MKICRFNENCLGLVEGNVVRDVTQALKVLRPADYPFPRYDVLIANLDLIRSAVTELAPRARTVPLSDVALLSPVANPGKIVAAPVNYQKHLKEVLCDPNLHHDNQINHIQRAGLFLKATSSLVGPSEGVALRKLDRRNDHEVELAVIIGKKAANVSKVDALKFVAGYCIGLDITIRGPEERSFRKSPDSYTVLGPWLVTSDELPDPSNLSFSISVNGEIRQRSNTSELILGVSELIEFASSYYTLLPGDVIITGTPEGVASIRPGDSMFAEFEGIGSMEVDVRCSVQEG
ncbi:fumarylacetoacetate hydrolase family protein [Burkholderia gladioli pv. gladioli]|uniref:FAA hydrolase family protein n=1 Tax=Burkholderia gladioli TaxID=28095 RepID=A0A095F2H3_BURGA|nr:fumarylacetoacetate hydrolase family protein [Burkholderia gladioli]AJW97677.1 fumarylacetoacetate (FAA) hydrolase family protein [Burkholderia gladioli]ASD79967.1 2-hydroxyhepta-2,4-diene-1,7-dioate isomerase [Burkholderia gladioli pv. gladioli]AWY54787.1 2-hydroxyhepta-2,4-diene-1,7-dioate isomerase [Burkholderia gladioli pv. gladioli]KGC11145.1 fumarylacetoacetate (FAA) hydrolase family protein [Burkholderia gladioli]MDJ1164225.1 fumarylacetoacetate hydrolase family protein [Burkholderia